MRDADLAVANGLPFGDIDPSLASLSVARWVVLPIPYDGTSTWGKGADRGPAALLEASANMELYHIETEREPYRQGIFTAAPLEGFDSPEEMVKAGYEYALGYLKAKKRLLTIGGEHSVSIGPIRACHEQYANLTVLQVDAHTDLRDSYEGSPFNHACVMARAQDLGPTVQVGIRSMDAGELPRVKRSRVFYAKDIQHGVEWVDQVLEHLTENVYLTIDLDGLDPSVLPATGTPEPGGLGWYQLLYLVERVVRERNVVAADIVELCPNELSHPSDFAAAKLAYHIMAHDGVKASM